MRQNPEIETHKRRISNARDGIANCKIRIKQIKR